MPSCSKTHSEIKKMTKNEIPTPTCTTCKKSGSENYMNGDIFWLCGNCGTEMKYMPAGELLNSGGSKVKENDGWVMSFSVRSSELYSGRAMFVLGLLTMFLTILFLWLDRIAIDAAFWSFGSGFLLSIIGKWKSIMQKKKTQMVLDQYPYWKK